MVGLGAARWASDQARILESWRCSSWPKALSKNLAWRCQDGSLVSGISGESAEGCMPARSFAVSSAVTSAARARPVAAQIKVAAKVIDVSDRKNFIRDPKLRPRGHYQIACGRWRKSAGLKP